MFVITPRFFPPSSLSALAGSCCPLPMSCAAVLRGCGAVVLRWCCVPYSCCPLPLPCAAALLCLCCAVLRCVLFCQMVVFYTVYNACLLAWSFWLYGKTMSTSLQARDGLLLLLAAAFFSSREEGRVLCIFMQGFRDENSALI